MRLIAYEKHTHKCVEKALLERLSIQKDQKKGRVIPVTFITFYVRVVNVPKCVERGRTSVGLLSVLCEPRKLSGLAQTPYKSVSG